MMPNILNIEMQGKSFFKKLVVFQLSILILGLISTYLVSSFFYKNTFHQQTDNVISSGIHLYHKYLMEKKPPLKDWCDLKLTDTLTPRITVIAKSGIVLCDNRAKSEEMDNHGNRPEVLQALIKGSGSSTRFSNTVNMDMVYGAIKTEHEGEIVYLRFALPLADLSSTIYKIQRSIFLILVPLFMLISILNIWFSIKEETAIRSESLKLKEDLTANISHEVRTPLTALKGHIQVIRSAQNEFPHKVRPFIDRMESSVNRLTQLFKDILDLSSLENKKNVFYEVVSPEELTERVVQNIQQIYADKNQTIKINIELEHFETDAKILEHLYTNLIDNAFKYTPENGTIEISWTSNDDKVLLKVSDTGVGIPQKDLHRIFERFFRVDASRSRELGGTGLGLAIVKHALSQLNGQVNVTSTEGVGTTFNVTLPKKGA